MNLKDFIARHLNDHVESARGVKQPSFFTWSERHIEEAIDIGISLVYSLAWEKFGRLQTREATEDGVCVLSFCDECDKFLGIVGIEIDGHKCLEISETSSKSNNLVSLLGGVCSESEPWKKSYNWRFVDNSSCIVTFDDPLPKGAVIEYLCAKKPTVEEFDDGIYSEYAPLVAEYAVFWLYRTDSESRSNIERASLHGQTFMQLVRLKLKTDYEINGISKSVGE